ncbi:MAG: alpha/beta hydrolase [Rhodothermaceae bacterium]|nr:MAG: alpha/beta hydrolase [Rhodothermaceae bacterium]
MTTVSPTETVPYGPDTLHLEVSGPETGPPVLLLHGWGSRASLMHPLAEALADRYRVYNPDLPGHGHSPPPPEPWGVPEHAGLVRDLIERNIGAPVTLIGHSNGGRIGLYMASDPALAPLVQRLVLISPSGITPRRTMAYHVRRMLARALKAPFAWLPPPLSDPALDWLRHSLVWKALGSSDYRALEGVMRGTFVKTVNCHLDDRVHRITVPTLIFWGDRDEAVSLEQMKRLEERIPDAGLVVLEGAGHYGHLDDPDTVIAATRYFLEHT